jgi:chitinase
MSTSFLQYCRCLLSLTAVSLLQSAAPAQPIVTKPRLLAYYASWDQFNTPAYTAVNIPYQRLTHICHAFLLLDTGKMDGSLLVPPELSEPELITRAHRTGTKVMISVGGGDEAQGRAFSTVVAVPGHRGTLIYNLTQFVTERGYDGVDIDWEVPTGNADRANCTSLIDELRQGLPDKVISMAVSATPGGWGDYDFVSLMPLVDFFNVMSYDYHGPWSSHAGHNSPFLLNPADPELEGSFKTTLDRYLELGVPAQQINMGTPFYGYEFDGVGDLWQYCPNNQCSTINSYAVPWSYVKQQLQSSNWKRRFDSLARASYLTSAGTRPTFLTYDDPYSTYIKVAYAVGVRNVGGVFMWEISQDYDGSSQDLLNAMVLGYLCFARDLRDPRNVRVR